MNCLLFRHGIAVEREEWSGDDADRPLTDKGRRRVRQVAVGLRAMDVRLTHILASPMVRAVETAKLLQTVFLMRSAVQLTDALLPDAVPELLLGLLQELPPESCVACVGHEPHLGQTAGLLLCGRSSEAFSLKKGGACSIDVSIPPKPGRGVLQWWLTPGQLRSLRKKKKKVVES